MPQQILLVDDDGRLVGIISEFALLTTAYDATSACDKVAKHMTTDVLTVDVNEQNPQAVGFYRHYGFIQVARSPLDGEGKPFPLLHMALPTPHTEGTEQC